MRRNVDDAADVVPTLVEEGSEAAMTRLHTTTDS